MLDLKFIRENTDRVRQGIEAKQSKVDLERLLDLDRKRREIIRKADVLKEERNRVSLEIGSLKKKGGDGSSAIQAMQKVAAEIKSLDESLKETEAEIQAIMIWIPNIPDPSVPVGPDATCNQVVRTWGSPPVFDFKAKPHWELGPALRMMDFERASRLSGSNFVVFTGAGARLERALIQFMLDLHVRKHGYTEVSVPHLVRREIMFGTGQLPKMEEDMYHVELEDLFLVPTAEVPVANLYREEMFKESDLPMSLTAYTPCFRREAGSYGADTRGLMRIHQFDKVEMIKFVRPEDSHRELEILVAEAEEVLQALELPYRVVMLATGDLSFSAAKCYDIEAYAPGIDRWLEVSSCSNCEDFQARRMNIRFRRDKGSKPEFVHILNGSGVALPRTLIALIENYQTDEGTVVVPQALRSIVGTDIIK